MKDNVIMNDIKEELVRIRKILFFNWMDMILDKDLKLNDEEKSRRFKKKVIEDFVENSLNLKLDDEVKNRL